MRVGAGGPLFQHAQGLDLRRLERDPARHHRQSACWGSDRGRKMDFSYTEEQTLLRNSRRALSSPTITSSTRSGASSRAATPAGDPKIWKQFAELGLLGASLPEEYRRPRRRPVETMIVMEEFGRALVVEPYVPTVVIGGGLLRACRQRRAEAGMAAEDRGRRSRARVRLCRAAGPLQSRRSHHHREEAGLRLCAERAEGRRARRRRGPTRSS